MQAEKTQAADLQQMTAGQRSGEAQITAGMIRGGIHG
jgi:hypothetical protein